MHSRSMNILLVEDNPGDARLLREMFKEQTSHDVAVTHVWSMTEAEQHLAEHPVDVLLLDLGLPDSQGLGAVRRAHAVAPHVPLVVLTGLDDEQLAVQALQDGAQDYLVKGQIETPGLLRAMRYAIERKLMQTQLKNEVAELKRMDTELRDSELMLRLALDASSQGVWRWEIGHDPSSFDLDAHCRSLFGLASETPVNYAVWANAIHIEDRATAEAGLARALDPAGTLDQFACDFRIVQSDAAAVWLSASGRASFEPDPAARAGRKPVRIVGTIRDISLAKRAEHERDVHRREMEKASNARFWLAAIAGSSDAAIVGKDLSGTVTSWNKAAETMFGYAADEIVGRSIIAIVPGDRIEEEASLLYRICRGEKVVQFETKRQCKTGTIIPVSLIVSPIRDDENKVIGASTIARDLTARDARERELRAANTELECLGQQFAQAREVAEQANEAKSRFLAGITHELRTPLHGILGYAELLSLDGGLTPTQSERLEAMMSAGEYLLGTINAVLDMSQIEADQLALSPAEVELSDLVRACLDVVRPRADTKRLALALAPTAPLRLIADPTRLRQVLINLLGNAVKFTPAGAIEVRLRDMEAEDCVRLEVADTGPGIPAIHQAELFGMFERLNAAAVSGIEGSGLGLAIAARLVQLMGGRIGYADNPGGGSVFWVELPRGAVASAAVEAAGPADQAGQPRLLVLVVDDEALNRNIATGFLRAAGHEVVCVDTGAAAVAAAAATDFDVILMDVRMPGMNGLEATRLIHALPGPRGRVRVVAVTAQAFAQQIEICRQAGMDGHVSKPFKQSVLLAGLVPMRTAPSHLEPGALLLSSTSAAPLPSQPEPVEPGDGDPGHTDPGAVLPLLDHEVFEEIAEYLLAAQMSEALQILITRCEAMLSGLRMTGTLSRADELAEAAHKLAGGAGTFGFMLVAAAARQYELAADKKTADTMALGDHLANVIEASLPIVRQELAAMTPETM